MTHNCRKCGVPLFIGENTTQKYIDHHDYICQDCRREYQCEYDRKRKDHVRAYKREHRDCIRAYRLEYDRAHGEQIRKRKRAYRHRTGRQQPMSKNKKCSSFLGIHVAERVLSHAFKNVERMPYGNQGYDFICNKGYKIDVKSSCRRHHGDWADSWLFAINKNHIADYFLCIAFDNREDLNPNHIWLIPAKDINDHVATSISETTLQRWGQYTIHMDNVQTCCTIMKNV